MAERSGELDFGAMAGIATDSKDNVWIVHRSAGVTMKKACCKAAPVVMQFDPSGRLLQSWEGPGDGYEWPLPNNEHGIFIDHEDNVWIAGRGATGTSENQILKFDSQRQIPPADRTSRARDRKQRHRESRSTRGHGGIPADQ